LEKRRPEYDLIVAGGGPAGSACAITAARSGARVLLLEKDCLPRHKVCGEFVSNESLQLLKSLLSDDLFVAHPHISSARIFLDRRSVSLALPMAARSIPRYELDSAMLDSARRAGVSVQESVTIREVDQSQAAEGGYFEVKTSCGAFIARAVVNATGRWSHLTRPAAASADSKWIGVKAHFRESSPPDSVDLYFFSGGYCGVQRVGPDAVNAAAMVEIRAARSMEEVLAAHPELWQRSRAWEPLFPAITTSPLYFRPPQVIDDQMLCAGDAAGFIDPFAGDGISLALHSGALAGQELTAFFQDQCSLARAQVNYRSAYRKQFAHAFRNAARLRMLLAAPNWIRSSLITLVKARPIAGMIVRGTRARVS
jgi:flavin-dependent dehydrogenase